MTSILRNLAKVCIVTAIWSLAGCGGSSSSSTSTDRSIQSVVPNSVTVPVTTSDPLLPTPTATATAGTTTTLQTLRICPLFISLKQLVYPAPGSTGIFPFTHVIVVTGTGTQVTLTSLGLPPIVSRQRISVPNPLPKPNAGGILGQEAFAIPTLGFLRKYTVIVQNTNLTGCPDGIPTTVGSFTTGFPLYPLSPSAP